jgi:hypothetical protein
MFGRLTAVERPVVAARPLPRPVLCASHHIAATGWPKSKEQLSQPTTRAGQHDLHLRKSHLVLTMPGNVLELRRRRAIASDEATLCDPTYATPRPATLAPVFPGAAPARRRRNSVVRRWRRPTAYLCNLPLRPAAAERFPSRKPLHTDPAALCAPGSFGGEHALRTAGRGQFRGLSWRG